MNAVVARVARAAAALAMLAAVVAFPVSSARTECVPDAQPGGAWPLMGGDLTHTRHQAVETRLGRVEAATLRPTWTFSANEASGEQLNEITGYPIVADGCVFVGSSRGFARPGWIFALNADGGDIAWKRRVFFGPDAAKEGRWFSGGVYSTLAVADGLVYAFVSRVDAPFVVALDARTGDVRWITTVDEQPGSDAVASPVVFDGMVWVGVSGTAAEGDESQRFDFRGRSVLLDARTGAILARESSIPDADWDRGRGDAGGAIWSTISIDAASKFGYVGTGNPFNYEREHPHTNAVVKIDLARARDAAGAPLASSAIANPAFGRIVASYKGDVEAYTELADQIECDEDEAVGSFLAGFECGRLDLDFGAAPNLFRDPRTGSLLVGAGQKSGVYHVFDAKTMAPVWRQAIGVPSAVGGIVGTPAFDGSSIVAPHTIGGYLVSMDRADGAPNWVAPVGDGVHWGSPVTSANGVVYTVDLKGFLDAYDSATGAPLLHRPLGLEADTGLDPTFTWGGASVARNAVYATVGVGLTSVGPAMPSMPDGFVIAFRPRRIS